MDLTKGNGDRTDPIVVTDENDSGNEGGSESSAVVANQVKRLRLDTYEQVDGQGCNWCFTLNNYIDNEVAVLKTMAQMEMTKWCIYGREVGESGTKHLQGYFVFAKNKRLAALREFLPRAHWEKAKGSHEQNFNYCSKDGDYDEFGVRPKFESQNGAKREINRWETAWSLAKENRIVEIEPQIKVTSYNNLRSIAKDFMKESADADNVTGIWIQGPSGCGKSREARRRYPGAFKKNANKWWDGYQGEEYVILDDLDPNHEILGHHFKIWADRYAFVAETKGGALNIRPKVFCITTQYKIDQIFKDEATREAIKRRFTVVDMFPVELYPVFNASQANDVPPRTPAPPPVLVRQTAEVQATQLLQLEEEGMMEPLPSGQPMSPDIY